MPGKAMGTTLYKGKKEKILALVTQQQSNRRKG
jgi:hypothetical protein